MYCKSLLFYFLAGMDYNAVGITVIFNGNQRANITIHTIDDTAVEDMETFNASLSADNIPAGLNVQIDPPSATFTIQDEGKTFILLYILFILCTVNVGISKMWNMYVILELVSLHKNVTLSYLISPFASNTHYTEPLCCMLYTYILCSTYVHAIDTVFCKFSFTYC